MDRVTARTRQWVALLLTILAFTAAVSAVGFWKYANYRYGGLDLAIYTNVLFSLSHGGGWRSSIQGSSYLGDHVEPILLLIAPLFRLWPDPRLLIVLQALVLGLTAVPVYFLGATRAAEVGRDAADTLARPRAPRSLESLGRSSRSSDRDTVPAPVASWSASSHSSPRRALVLAGIWLLNPLLWNAALFEFHALAFAPLFLISAAVAYVRRRFWWFILWILLALAVREDVALIVAMFGVVALVRWWKSVTTTAEVGRTPADTLARPGVSRSLESLGRSLGLWPRSVPASLTPRFAGAHPSSQSSHALLWIITPFILGLAWFAIATRIAASHASGGAYKFLIYYGWLGDSFASVIGGAFAHPLRVLTHIVTLGNLELLLGLLMAFLFLPILCPKWLLLALPALLQIALSGSGGGALIIETHYALLFVPALVLASADALAGRPFHIPHSTFLIRFLPLPRRAAIALGVVVYLAAAYLLGPFPGIARVVVWGASADDLARRAAYDTLLARVPEGASIAAPEPALPCLASRSRVYSTSYAYLGVRQFAQGPYALPDDLTYLLLDARELAVDSVVFPRVGWASPFAAGGPERIRTIIRDRGLSVIAEQDDVALLAQVPGAPLPERYLMPPREARGQLMVDELRDVRLTE